MRAWPVFAALALANVVLAVTAGDTGSRVLHAVGAVSFTVTALAARSRRPRGRS
ncbi:hypothetical protein OG423_15635 [Micromonospora zamorensis]|uniref:hypothetical protein n=1 Tax=Micromonospora zamorensis TaxID=709883 RepID=UPI00352B8CD0|nr:hypothetical protein OG423_15635 [Micromonospora zamorensis]